MSQRLRRHSSSLRALAKAPETITRAVVRGCDDALFKCLCECAVNVLNGNVPLTTSEYSKLKVHKTGLRQLADKRVNRDKKRIILQQGGFLGALLAPIAASVLGPVVRSIVGGGRG